MTSTLDDEQFIKSETFAIRTVVRLRGLVPGSERVVGADFWGRLPNGNRWPQVAIGLQGARYQDVTTENADVFDRINSACWIRYPEH